MKKIVMSVAALAMVAGFGSAVAGDAAAGKAKFAVCSGCHGATGAGNAALGYPKLAGQSAADIAGKLNGYKSGALQNATMQAMTAGLSAADIDNIAAYVGTMK